MRDDAPPNLNDSRCLAVVFWRVNLRLDPRLKRSVTTAFRPNYPRASIGLGRTPSFRDSNFYFRKILRSGCSSRTLAFKPPSFAGS
jgi:hypothetical protein